MPINSSNVQRPEAEETSKRFSQILSPGDENPPLNRMLEEDISETDVSGIQGGKCQLCKIEKEPWNRNEIIYEHDPENGYFIVDTAGAESKGLKGHEVRNMAVLQQHGIVTPEAQRMVDRLVEITASHIDHDYMVLYGSMQSFSEHMHVVASDIHGDDMEKINNYIIYDIEDSPEPIAASTYDLIGEYIQEAAGINDGATGLEDGLAGI